MDDRIGDAAMNAAHYGIGSYAQVMNLAEVIEHLRALAPEHLAEPWDKVGLHVGDPEQDVRRGLLCIDLTEPVLAEAVRVKCELIVAYHPPISEPVARLTTATWKERLLREAVQRSIAVYSPHTALDAARDGVNDWLADALGPGARRAIRPHVPNVKAYKLVTFVPHPHIDRLRAAMSDAGAGVIGDYTQCSFSTPGHGTFLGGATTNPTVGQRGRLETVDELRMEMLVPAARLRDVLAAHHANHPYEEPAFDIYPLEAPPGDVAVGQGRVVELERPTTIDVLVGRLKKQLGVRWLEVAKPQALAGASRRRGVKRVAVCAGAGGSLLKDAALSGGDAFITGEMRHHDVLDAVQRGVGIILAGHTQTERPYLPVYRQRLAGLTVKGVSWRVSRMDREPSELL